MALPRSFAPFRHRAYARVWAGAFASNIGTWMEAVAVGILIQKTTHQNSWTALVAAVAFVPIAVLGPVGGALADRMSRKRLILTTTTVSLVLASLLAVLAATHEASPGRVLVIMLGAGCSSAIGFPTYQTILPDLVPREDLPAAVALSAAQWNLGRVIGPALAGIMIALGGYSWAFAINAVSFLAVIAAIAPLVLPPPTPTGGASIFSSMRDGFRFVRADGGIRAAWLLMAINSFFAAPFIGLVPAMAIDVLHRGSGGTATLVTAQGIGAVLMALALGSLIHQFGLRRILVTVLTSLPVALVLYAFAPSLPLSALTIFVVGFFYLGALSSFTTVAQLRAPTEFRGRTLSAFTVVLGSLYPLGLVVQGVVSDEIGLRETTVSAAVLMAVALLVLRLAWPHFTAALDDDQPMPEVPLAELE